MVNASLESSNVCDAKLVDQFPSLLGSYTVYARQNEQWVTPLSPQKVDIAFVQVLLEFRQDGLPYSWPTLELIERADLLPHLHDRLGCLLVGTSPEWLPLGGHKALELSQQLNELLVILDLRRRHGCWRGRLK